MLDLFAQHRHLGVVERLFRSRILELRDQVLGAAVLDFGLVEELLQFLVAGRTQCRIEDLFLDLRVDDQLAADHLDQLGLLLGRHVVLALLVLVEHLLDVLMVFLQLGNRVLSGFGSRGGRPRRGRRF